MAKCNASRPQLAVSVDVRYQGRREETNMVIVNVKLLSGYVLDQSSLHPVGGLSVCLSSRAGRHGTSA